MGNAVTGRKNPAKDIIDALLGQIGITINGKEPWDIQVNHDNFYARIIQQGALGMGESYMDKWWDCKRLDMLFDKILKANLDEHANIPLRFKLRQLISRIINLQTLTRSKVVAKKHYDLGNDLFHAMLDPRMIYSCGYFKETTQLDDAQTKKLDLICQKLKLRPGLKLLDIRCGWGGLAKYAAENYGVSVVGVTISEKQYTYASKYCKDLPVTIRLQDYREINEQFDRIVSVGMFEHVGHLNYSTFMKTAHRSLAHDGLFLLHTIGVNQFYILPNAWISKYIFPNGNLPTISQIASAAEKLFVVEDWHNFGAYYDNTLMAWHDNFVKNWPGLSAKYDERFFRMWVYYLLSCAGGFRARSLQLWQIVFSKGGINGVYQAPR
jgi:cyclopropane-fatty-acyl-phospholipid synthase